MAVVKDTHLCIAGGDNEPSPSAAATANHSFHRHPASSVALRPDFNRDWKLREAQP